MTTKGDQGKISAPSGLHSDDIGAIMGGISHQAVWCIFHRAKSKLKDKRILRDGHLVSAWSYLGRLLMARQAMIERDHTEAYIAVSDFELYIASVIASSKKRKKSGPQPNRGK